jgi:hypothetical protein
MEERAEPPENTPKHGSKGGTPHLTRAKEKPLLIHDSRSQQQAKQLPAQESLFGGPDLGNGKKYLVQLP